MMKPQIPETYKQVAEALKEFLGERSDIGGFYDEQEENVVAIVESVGVPHRKLATSVTASVHGCPNMLDDVDIRVELLLVGADGTPEMANLLATAAFYVTKNRWLAAPGVVFPGMIREYFPKATVEHLLWVEPFDFDGLSPLCVPDLDYEIHPLQAVPLTESEHQFLKLHGFNSLNRLLLSDAIAHYDLYREPVI